MDVDVDEEVFVLVLVGVAVEVDVLVLVDVDAEEFMLLVRLLHSLPSMSTLTGRQDLVNIIMAQSELDKPYAVCKT